MKKLFVIGTMILLASCGSDSSSKAKSCSDSPFQIWTRSDGLKFDMSQGVYNQDLELSYGGACIGVFNIGSDGTFQELDCGYSFIAQGTYGINNCSGTLFYENGDIINFSK